MPKGGCPRFACQDYHHAPDAAPSRSRGPRRGADPFRSGQGALTVCRAKRSSLPWAQGLQIPHTSVSSLRSFSAAASASVRSWNSPSHRAFSGGCGLIDGKAPGNTCKLNDRQRQALVNIVESGLMPAIHGVVRWRLKDLAMWIWEEFRISISETTLSRELPPPRSRRRRPRTTRARRPRASDQREGGRSRPFPFIVPDAPRPLAHRCAAPHRRVRVRTARPRAGWSAMASRWRSIPTSTPSSGSTARRLRATTA